MCTKKGNFLMKLATDESLIGREGLKEKNKNDPASL
jgi:hypothetical protein